MKEQLVVVQNRAGLHARPAAMLVQIAGKFKSSVYLEKDSEKVNGKSIMGVITLGAVFDTKINIITDGEDEETALQTLVDLFNSKFEED